jgi:curli biogenesis system outer membrane secretion channel CsgG
MTDRLRAKQVTLQLVATGLLLTLGIGSINTANAKEVISSVDRSTPNILSLNIDKKAKRTRIAVMDFDYNAIADQWHWWFRSNAQGVNDILVNKLVDNGTFAVIERSKLQSIIAEQNLGNSNRVDASSAAKIGRLLGVQAIVIGSVTEFNVEKDGGGISIPMFGSIGGAKTTANVRVSARVVDTKTGEILLTAEGNGSSNHGDNTINIRGFSFGSGSSSKEAKLLSTAAADAVQQLSVKINNGAGRVIDAINEN